MRVKTPPPTVVEKLIDISGAIPAFINQQRSECALHLNRSLMVASASLGSGGGARCKISSIDIRRNASARDDLVRQSAGGHN